MNEIYDATRTQSPRHGHDKGQAKHGMAHETPNTKFPRDIKGPSSDYGGSDVDDALLEAEGSSSWWSKVADLPP